MTFPAVAGSAALTQLTSANPGTVQMPAGIQAGELLIAICAGDTSGSMSQSGGSDWTRLANQSNGTAVHGAVFAKVAAGGDSLSVQFEASDFAAVAFRVSGHGVSDPAADITVATPSTGFSITPNPPDCFIGTAADYLWIEGFAADDDDNFLNYQTSGWTQIGQAESAQSSSSCMAAAAYLQQNASSMNPGNMTMALSEEWVAFTFAIPPAAGENKNVTDTGSGAEGIGIAVGCALSDAGAGADAFGAAAAFGIADLGGGADAVDVGLLVALAEACAGADSAGISATVSIPDSGTGGESLAVSIVFNLADAGAGAEAVIERALVTIAEAAAGAEGISVSVTVELAELALGADAVEVLSGTFIQIADAAAGADNLSLAVRVPLAEGGAGADVLSLAAALAIVEQALGADVAVHMELVPHEALIVFSLRRRSVDFALRRRSLVFALHH